MGLTAFFLTLFTFCFAFLAQLKLSLSLSFTAIRQGHKQWSKKKKEASVSVHHNKEPLSFRIHPSVQKTFLGFTNK